MRRAQERQQSRLASDRVAQNARGEWRRSVKGVIDDLLKQLAAGGNPGLRTYRMHSTSWWQRVRRSAIRGWEITGLGTHVLTPDGRFFSVVGEEVYGGAKDIERVFQFAYQVHGKDAMNEDVELNDLMNIRAVRNSADVALSDAYDRYVAR